MKIALAGAAVAGLIIFAAQAQGGPESGSQSASAAPSRPLSWSVWASGFRVKSRISPAAERADAPPAATAEEFDVVDAHWMALTMWGEARGQGENGMRAVGHVIDNRWRANGRHGPFVTDTVSEAWQFSCWNTGDPNRRAIENIDALRDGSDEHRMWLAARRIAEEIMSGRSEDPTGGALFYHAEDVAPHWAAGAAPIARIGGHVFYATVG